MAKNLARDPDIPAYDTYPGPAALEELRMRSSHDIEFAPREGRELNRTAEQIGLAVGRVVETARELPHRVAGLRHRFGVIRGGAGRTLSEQAGDLAGTARQRLHHARARAQVYAHENPLTVIFGAAAAGLALGTALRLWRSRG